MGARFSPQLIARFGHLAGEGIDVPRPILRRLGLNSIEQPYEGFSRDFLRGPGWCSLWLSHWDLLHWRRRALTLESWRSPRLPPVNLAITHVIYSHRE